MYDDLGKDVGVVEKYCQDYSNNAGMLSELSLEALELFLSAVRLSDISQQTKAAIAQRLVNERDRRIEICLGGRVMTEIKRDFEMATSIVSWNVNGIRSRIIDNKTGNVSPRPIEKGSPITRLMNDPEIRANILCMQETKIRKEVEPIFSDSAREAGWSPYWSSSSCDNYSGVSTWIKADFNPGVVQLLPTKEFTEDPDDVGVPVFPDFIMKELYARYPKSRERLASYQRNYQKKKEEWEKKRPKKGKQKSYRPKAGSCHPLVNGGRILVLRVPTARVVVVNTYAPNTGKAGSTTLGSLRDYRRRLEKGEDLPSSTPFLYKESTDGSGAANAGGGLPEEAIVVDYREDWDRALALYLKHLNNKASAEGESVIWCGDLNVARSLSDIHQGDRTTAEIDRLTRRLETNPSKSKEIEKELKKLHQRQEDALYLDKHGGHSGFRKTERIEFERILQTTGLVDVYRHIYPAYRAGMTEKEIGEATSEQLAALGATRHELQAWKRSGRDLGFTYWNQQRPTARTNNEGMRIDYFCVSQQLTESIYMEVFPDIGYAAVRQPSDHAPILLKILTRGAGKETKKKLES